MRLLNVPGFVSRTAMAAVITALALGAAPSRAAAESNVNLNIEYTVSLAGIPLADFRFYGKFNGPDYNIQASGGSLALTSVIANFKVTSESVGRYDGQTIDPGFYFLKMKMSDKKQKIDIGFDKRTVNKLVVEPPVKPAYNRIDLKKTHKRNVVDPLSAVLMSIPSGDLTKENACSRRIPIFDGSYRYDMVLSPKRVESRPVSGARGKSTNVFVCKVKYVPIAGHREGRRMTEFWSKSEDIEVWLMPIRSVASFVPYKLIIPTPIGNAEINVTKVKLRRSQQRASAQ